MSDSFPNLLVAIENYEKYFGNSRAQLAGVLCVSRATITRWAQGEEPEVKRIRAIAEALNVSVAYLAGEQDLLLSKEERDLLMHTERYQIA